jgi:hypothetical protein
MTEGEEDKAEDEEERTESDSDARDFVRLPRGTKRGATSSSQGALRPPEGEGKKRRPRTWRKEDPRRGESSRGPSGCARPSSRAP